MDDSVVQLFFCTELATVIFFVATKDKFEVLHLPDLISGVQFISLTALLKVDMPILACIFFTFD